MHFWKFWNCLSKGNCKNLKSHDGDSSPKSPESNMSQPAITCSKLTIETLEQGVKCVQS